MRRLARPAIGDELDLDQAEEPPGGAARSGGEAPRLSDTDDPSGADLGGLLSLHEVVIRRGGRAANPQTRAFRRKHFPGVRDRDWNDFHWQLRNAVTTVDALRRFLVLSFEEERALVGDGVPLPFRITPYYLSLLDPQDPRQPLRRTMVPTVAERERAPEEADDPLGEEGQSPVPGLVHRYPDRVLFLLHDRCAAYCRYCTRSRLVGHGDLRADLARWRRALDYIRATPAVRDVLLSGGDSLLLPDDVLEWILGQVRSIPHVEVIRIGTKVPAVLPMRVTPGLVRRLRKFHPLWMSLHFTHPDECTPEAATACGRLADAGIPLGSQTVLLRGVNDDLPTMRSLLHRLQQMRVRPYYLYQCDPVPGSAHFRTPVRAGLDLLEGLRGHTSGYAVPTYVIDAPGGGGKIPLMPNYLTGRTGQDVLLRNFAGGAYRYPDVAERSDGGRGAPDVSA